MQSRIRNYLHTHTNPPVFLISGVVILVLVVLAATFPTGFGNVADSVENFITTYFGWFYMFSATLFLVFVVGLMISRYGSILRLGPDDSRPEFDTWSWVSMMFTAGMGIGFVYYGVSEPIAHFKNPPVADPGTSQAALRAMNFTFFHWGLHPGAI